MQHLQMEKKKNKSPRKPAVLRPKSERDCRFCQEDKVQGKDVKRETPISWQLRKGKGGPKKHVNTAGNFCSNESCEFYGISDEAIHALVGYSTHGVNEETQACGKKFSAWRSTNLYRLKSHSELVEKILWLFR